MTIHVDMDPAFDLRIDEKKVALKDVNKES